MNLYLVIHRLVVAIVVSPVRIYRRVISPLKQTPSCRYLPTCSDYALEAVEKRGVIIGSGLAMWRVIRCNPLFHAGYDPVPARRERAHHCGEHH